MDNILNRILRLIEESGISAYKLEKEAGHLFVLYIVLPLSGMTLYIALFLFMQ